MAETHVISALVQKRAELSGELAQLDDRRAAIKAHIANLDAVLRLFRYTGNPALIKPRRKKNWIFRRGELRRMVLDIEREATKPLHKEDNAREIMARKGWGPNPDLLETISDKVKDVKKRAAQHR
ncbi:MAG: hypothetical protein L0287_15215 [Anaerolineae bacterium]|nr:hypothetical protein [Anaerolineae bacterium]